MSPKVRYEDFEVEVRSIAKRRYEVRALNSPRGRGGSKFVPPYPADKLDGILSALEGRVRSSSRAGRDLEWEDGNPEAMPLQEVEDLGRTLFRALFRGDVERRFLESLGAVHERRRSRLGRGLCLRVTFDRNEDFALLATLPWEFLWDQGRFLSRDRLTPVVRSLNAAPPPSRAEPAAPLRVLLIPSNPTDLPSLKIGVEAGLVRRALKHYPGIETVTMRHPTLDKLRRLGDEVYHVVHFMGHGGLVEHQRDHFVLYFERTDHVAAPVPSMLLAECLQAVRGLRLVVLNSCWSGAFPRRQGQDPFTGVAASLVARGMPAVVAMQFPISDAAAIAFSQAFYERLARGDSVSAAATKGRLAILESEPESLEWATPVVFLAGEDRGFNVRPAGAKPQQEAPPTGPNEAMRPKVMQPVRLAVRSFRAPYVADTETPDDLLDLTPFFEGRYIKDVSLWREEVYPRLHEFLLRHESERRPIVFDFAAHMTIAFAAGYCLEAKSGMDVTLLQKGVRGVRSWRAESGPAREGPLWRDEADLVLNPRSSAVALAVSAAQAIVGDVSHYLKKSRKAIGRLVPLTVHPEPNATAVQDGLHALQLAQDMSLRIRARSVQERMRPLHLFAAAPNALLFFLGQLARSFGEVQLYEHDFESKKPGAYMPSLRLPVPTDP